MIQETITYTCPHCASSNLVKNGHNAKGKQQYRCRDCGKSGVLNPSVRYTKAQKEQILQAYYERPSLRGIERIFGVARQTVAAWLKKSRNASRSARHLVARSTRRHARTG